MKRSAGRFWLVILIAFATGCRGKQSIAPSLPQRGYLWQRDWTPAVTESLLAAQGKLDAVIILGGEIVWTEGKPQFVRANIDWGLLKNRHLSCSIALRVAPPRQPFWTAPESARFVETAARSLIDEAQTNSVELTELQIDYDCPAKELKNYAAWLRQLRSIVSPERLIVTTLPAWFEEKEFKEVALAGDGYVLQVHSVPTAGLTARVCDPQLARRWVKKAAGLGIPFSVALPTYRCLAGYAPSGKLLGVAMDSVEPSWPPDTRILEFETDPDEMADLVAEWRNNRPAEFRELIWYRLPVATDTRNWRWATLTAVMSGRRPTHQLDVSQEGEDPVDIAIVNAGEADERLHSVVNVTWQDSKLDAADALTGWSVSWQKTEATFTPTPGFFMRLAPGAKRRIGWLRFERPTTLQLKLIKQNDAPR